MIQYREATGDDIPQLVRLRKALLTEVMQLHEPEGTDISESLTQYFTEQLGSNYICWLATDCDTIVSTGGIFFYDFPPNFFVTSSIRGYILNIYTQPGYRRQGHAHAIFGKLMEESRARRVMQVSLHASPDGRELYGQFGFVARDNEMVWKENAQLRNG